jgi:DNA modification methylase
LRRQSGTARQAARRLRGFDLHRPALQRQPQLRSFLGRAKEKRAFEDRHENTKAYIDYMRPRCVQLARVLKQTGSFYYDCDWHASHCVNAHRKKKLAYNLTATCQG